MATFPSYKPVYPATKKSEPKIRRAVFSTGYEQRSTLGLNINLKQWSVEFNLSEEDANVVEAFLDARALDCQSFTWTPPDSDTSYKWICSTWDRNLFDVNRSRITATFIQVAEPPTATLIVDETYGDWPYQIYHWEDSILLDWWSN